MGLFRNSVNIESCYLAIEIVLEFDRVGRFTQIDLLHAIIDQTLAIADYNSFALFFGINIQKYICPQITQCFLQFQILQAFMFCDGTTHRRK